MAEERLSDRIDWEKFDAYMRGEGPTLEERIWQFKLEESIRAVKEFGRRVEEAAKANDESAANLGLKPSAEL